MADADDGPAAFLFPLAPFDRHLAQREKLLVEFGQFFGFLVGQFILFGERIAGGFDLGEGLRLFGGHRLRLAVLPAIAAQRLIGTIGHDLDPFPAFAADGIRLALKPRGAEPVEQGRVGKIALMLGLKEIGDDLPARLAIGIKPGEHGTPVAGRHMSIRETAADAARTAVEAGRFEPSRFLRGVIVRDGKGHQLLERHSSVAIELHQARADAGELEALIDEQDTHAEARRDVFDAAARIDQLAKGVELVGGVHGLPHLVFGEARFRYRPRPSRTLQPMLGVLGDLLAFGEQLERGEPPRPGNDLIFLVGDRPHLQILQEAVRGDAGGEFVDADLGAGLAHIRRRRNQGIEGNHLDVHGSFPLLVVDGCSSCCCTPATWRTRGSKAQEENAERGINGGGPAPANFVMLVPGWRPFMPRKPHFVLAPREGGALSRKAAAAAHQNAKKKMAAAGASAPFTRACPASVGEIALIYQPLRMKVLQIVERFGSFTSIFLPQV